MKSRNDIRFATTGSALRRAGRLRAPCTHAGIASGARAATTSYAVARRSRSLRLVMQLATAPVVAIAIAIAIAALSAGNPATAAMAAAAATLACAIAVRGATASAGRRIAPARAAPFMPSPARRRPFSSVRLTLMQDHSS